MIIIPEDFLLWRDDAHYLMFHRHYSTGQRIAFQAISGSITPDVNFTMSCEATDLYLRLRLEGTEAVAEWSADGITWIYAASYSNAWLGESSVQAGLIATHYQSTAPEIAVDFDYFRVDSLATVEVQVPNGGEVWNTQSMNTVRWASTGLSTGVKIEIDRHYPNGPWEVLADSTANDGEELVWVPGTGLWPRAASG